MNNLDEISDLLLHYRYYVLSTKLTPGLQIPPKAQDIFIHMQKYVEGLFRIDIEKLNFHKQHLGTDHKNVVINCHNFDTFGKENSDSYPSQLQNLLGSMFDLDTCDLSKNIADKHVVAWLLCKTLFQSRFYKEI